MHEFEPVHRHFSSPRDIKIIYYRRDFKGILLQKWLAKEPLIKNTLSFSRLGTLGYRDRSAYRIDEGGNDRHE